jgi:hypothetical protein
MPGEHFIFQQSFTSFGYDAAEEYWRVQENKPMPHTCTCAKSLDTQRAQTDARCPTCGLVLVATDVTTAIKTELPVRHPTNVGLDDDPLSIRKKRRLFPLALGVGLIFGGLTAGTLAWQYLRIDARKDIGPITKRGSIGASVQAYYLKHNGEFPATLDMLLQKDEFGGPYLENADSLLDEWGNPFQYDIKGPRNKGTKPDIWSVAPDGTLIGNWQQSS